MINSDTIQAFRTDFKKYLKPFISAQYKDDINVIRNIIHTEKVVENILILADSLELSENEKCTAEVVALFHDIGRFWMLLQDQNEIKGYDHALASVQYLNTNHTFNSLDESIRKTLTEIILNHHLPEIPKKDNGATLFFTKLLRDADKLDIWRSTTDYLVNKNKRSNMAIELELSQKLVVTDSFCHTIIEGGIPNKQDIVTFSDLLLYQMSWVFDLNFRKSYQLLNQKQYMRHIYDALPKSDSVFEIYRMIKIHIENQIL
jgi:hypothetical protein